jgi:serine/threonine protein kinase
MKRVDALEIAGVDSDVRYTSVIERTGLPMRHQGPWLVVGETQRVQGWKLHLSSIPEEALPLLERVVPLLVEEKVSFKFARTPALLGSLNEGGFGDLQVGKFLTIYPQSDLQARGLAGRLVGETSGFHGPIIVTDLRLGEVTYTRYGSFRPVIKQNRLGQLYPAIYDEEGKLGYDRYTVPFELPAGVANPFDGAVGTTRTSLLPNGAHPEPSRQLFGPGYLLLDILKAHPKGSVFLALDLRAQSEVGLCVLKQGRQFCLSDSFGRDMRTRLRHQAALSSALSLVLSTPKVGEYFEVNGHGYLPLEYVEAVTLLELAVAARDNCSWNGLTDDHRARSLGYMRELARHLASMHAAGFVHRDLSPTNVMIRDHRELWLMDLELAHAIGDTTPPFGKGTPGYMSPEQELGGEAMPAQDVYGFGCLLVFLLCGCDPRWVVTIRQKELRQRLHALSGGASEDLLEITARCLAKEPSSRPEMSEVCRWLLEEENTPARSRCRVVRHDDAGNREPLDCSQLETVISEGVRGLLADALRDSDTGLWLSPSEDTDLASGASRSFELRRDAHHGVAGVVYSLARLARLGYVDHQTASPHLLSAIQWLLAGSSNRRDNLPGLYFGDAGVAAALFEADVSGFAVDKSAIYSTLASSLDAPIDWLDITHGAAGQGIAAMLCESLLGRPQEVVERFAQHLLETQQKDGSWRVPPGVDGLSGQTLTGFAHGCAGIVYFLVTCTARYGMSHLEPTWRRGAEWLVNRAEKGVSGTWEWPCSDTQADRWKWWCHGSPGIALTFLQLFKLTGNRAFGTIAVDALNVHREDARSTNLSICHGLTGLGEIYLEAASALGDEYWLRRAQAIAATLIALARPSRSGHLTWLVENPYVSTADLMVGTAGILHFLARLHSKDAHLSFPLLVKV